MIAPETVTAIGRITRTHGTRGELSVSTEGAVELGALSCIVLDMDGILVPFYMSTVRDRGTGATLVTLDGVTSEEQARAFVGHTVYALDSDLDNAADDDNDGGDGYYLEDLVGWTILDTDGTVAGRITDFDDSTANVLFVIECPDGATAYIPAADDLITAIDPDARTVTVDIPAGLL